MGDGGVVGDGGFVGDGGLWGTVGCGRWWVVKGAFESWIDDV